MEKNRFRMVVIALTAMILLSVMVGMFAVVVKKADVQLPAFGGVSVSESGKVVKEILGGNLSKNLTVPKADSNSPTEIPTEAVSAESTATPVTVAVAPAEEPQTTQPQSVPMDAQPVVDLEAYSQLVPVGGMVNLSNPIPLPEDFPADWETMTLAQKTEWVQGKVGGPVQPIPGEEHYGWQWNGKNIVSHMFNSPSGFTVHATLTSGEGIIFYRGHNEPQVEFDAVSYRIEALIPGMGGLCYNWNGVQAYEFSRRQQVFGLGEVMDCPPLPEYWSDQIDYSLAEALKLVQEASGSPVISIGTDGFNGRALYQIYPDSLGTTTITVPSGYYGVYTVDGATWESTLGPKLLDNVKGAYLIDLSVVSDCEKIKALFANMGMVFNSPLTCPAVP